MSVVTNFLDIVRQESNGVGGHSWRNLNAAMRKGLRLAIVARFKFELEDFNYIVNCKEYSYHEWAGSDNEYSQGEGFHRLAVDSGNVSAATSFEKMQGRKPLIYRGKRLAINSEFFWWDDEALKTLLDLLGLLGLPEHLKLYLDEGKCSRRWFLTSFSEDGQRVNCCCYDRPDNPCGWRTGNPSLRKTMSFADFKLAEKGQNRAIKNLEKAEEVAAKNLEEA